MNEKKQITLAELKKLLASNNPGLKIIDIRSAEEYNKLHIPMAKNIPVELLIDASAFFKKDDLLICVCNKGHERSQNAAALLFSKGFEHSFYLEGGTIAWFDTEKQTGVVNTINDQ